MLVKVRSRGGAEGGRIIPAQKTGGGAAAALCCSLLKAAFNVVQDAAAPLRAAQLGSTAELLLPS